MGARPGGRPLCAGSEGLYWATPNCARSGGEGNMNYKEKRYVSEMDI